MRDQFEKLMQAFCHLVKLLDARHVIEGTSFDVDGTPCAILFNEKVVADRCIVHAELGQPPADNEARVFYELLRQNFASSAVTGPTLKASSTTPDTLACRWCRARASPNATNTAMPWPLRPTLLAP